MMPMNLPSKENFDKQVWILVSSANQINQNISGKVLTPADEQPKPIPTSTRKTPTLRYCAKKTNTDHEQRSKTVDVVRLKAG